MIFSNIDVFLVNKLKNNAITNRQYFFGNIFVFISHCKYNYRKVVFVLKQKFKYG